MYMDTEQLVILIIIVGIVFIFGASIPLIGGILSGLGTALFAGGIVGIILLRKK